MSTISVNCLLTPSMEKYLKDRKEQKPISLDEINH